MKSGARPGAALSPARFVIPGVLGLLAVGYLCASLASPLFASLAVGLISVCVLLLISDRRGPWLAVEAMVLGSAQYGLHHGLEVLGRAGVQLPRGCTAPDGILGCAGDLGWRGLVVVGLRVLIALLVVLALRQTRQALERFVVCALAPRVQSRIFGLRQLVSCRARRAQALERLVRSTPRRGPPMAPALGL
ncbi:hypothetical protein LWF15_13525 [Kineosporia rhizophila]|uniref:hypothetical protein n=1 Tax=Kineosporia TaxID=49184 RepID=UPI001E3E8866|nr:MULTISPECIES: hypothetical protein [Kineosporia]MCE0536532.1 hypothetical protein [Kineosporia rhizophila]GLY15373.1 hypothetical protein Kisp01_23880 [Kineosporia sp. NBRC 101677]